MSTGHIDWHENSISGLKICAVLDDSSCKILTIGEFATINTENSIAVLEQRWLGHKKRFPSYERDNPIFFCRHVGTKTAVSGISYEK